MSLRPRLRFCPSMKAKFFSGCGGIVSIIATHAPGGRSNRSCLRVDGGRWWANLDLPGWQVKFVHRHEDTCPAQGHVPGRDTSFVPARMPASGRSSRGIGAFSRTRYGDVAHEFLRGGEGVEAPVVPEPGDYHRGKPGRGCLSKNPKASVAENGTKSACSH
jgi:hypothetical protein